MNHSFNFLRTLSTPKMLIGLFTPLVIGLAVTWLIYNDEISLYKADIVNIGNQSAALFEREITVRNQSVRAMQMVCEQHTAKLECLTWNPANYLVPVVKNGGYKLEFINSYTQKPIGSLTGLGQLPSPTSQAAEEMEMAIALTPIFQAIIQRDPDTPWLYYVSASGFVYIYPYVNAADFFFSPQLYQADFYRGVTPSQNPDRKLYWTPAYLDLAGKGYMVTLSAPIYKGDEFLGCLCIDVSAARLKWMLDRYSFPYSTAYLIDGSGTLLVNTPGLITNVDFTKLPNGVMQKFGAYYLTRIQIYNSDWSIIVQTPYFPLVFHSLNKAGPWGFVIFLLLFCILLVFHLNRVSTTDALTGLYNRRQYDIVAPMIFDNATRRGDNIAFLIYDFDDFKKLNDTYGHQHGDKVLTQVSDTISKFFKRKSDYIFRTGGEEFVIIAATQDKQLLQKLADNICRAVYDLQIPNKAANTPYLTISVGGVCLAGSQRFSLEDAYKAADKALYHAKQNGKNQAYIITIPD